MVVTFVACCAMTTTSELLRALHEVIEALDRRIPDVGRIDEAKIAADSRKLRAEASTRIALLKSRGCGTSARQSDTVT